MTESGIYAEIIEEEVFRYYAYGEWKTSSSGKSVPLINPRTSKIQYRVQGQVFC